MEHVLDVGHLTVRVGTAAYLPLTVTTGHCADAITRCATLPTKNLFKPDLPWVPRTIMSACVLRAARTICSAGSPVSVTSLARTPPFLAVAVSFAK